MRELAGAERISAEEQVVLARKALEAGSDQLRFFGREVCATASGGISRRCT
jgi:hypothetical protein